MSYVLDIRRTIPLPLAQTFATLADHNRLGAILGLPCKRVRDGQGDVNGVGSVRRMGLWPLDFEETVTAFEPGARIDYRITRGTPLRNHRGHVRFEADGDERTRVTWHIEYDMAVPLLGGVIRQALGVGIGRGLGKIGR